jgi:hypothetical protein
MYLQSADAAQADIGTSEGSTSCSGLPHPRSTSTPPHRSVCRCGRQCGWGVLAMASCGSGSSTTSDFHLATVAPSLTWSDSRGALDVRHILAHPACPRRLFLVVVHTYGTNHPRMPPLVEFSCTAIAAAGGDGGAGAHGMGWELHAQTRRQAGCCPARFFTFWGAAEWTSLPCALPHPDEHYSTDSLRI